MDLKKRRTVLRHMCGQCYRSYSRFWVLKRHLLQQHGIQHLGDSVSIPSPPQSAFPKHQNLMMMMMGHDLTVKEPPVESNTQIFQAEMRLALEIIKPIYRGTELALQNYRAYFQARRNLYFPFPRLLISGFSCFFCGRCWAKEPPIPIKDRGSDLTCEARHRCQGRNAGFKKLAQVTSDQRLGDEMISLLYFRTNKLSPDQRSKLSDNMFGLLFSNIDLWIPGKKLILVNKIAVPGGYDDDTIRKYVEKQYDIPNKYYVADVEDFQRSPWILRLLHNGKIEPTAEELIDFCYYCVGTYAILRVHLPDSVKYYIAFLASAESIEKSDSTGPNESLYKT